MKYLDYLWRLFGTALSFAVFGIAGVIFGLVLFPCLFVFVRGDLARQRAARRVVGAAFRTFVSMMNGLGVLSYEFVGERNVREKSCLIVANHPTLIDVVFLVSMFPQADCVIKHAVTRNPFMRSTAAAANYISNVSLEDLLDACIKRLRSGGSLLLFPEGTRSVPGQPVKFKPGAATVAIRGASRVLPVAIQCQPRFLTKEKPWYYVPPSRPHFTITIMPPVSIGELVPDCPDERRARQMMNDALHRLITEHLPDRQVACNIQSVGARSRFY